jgi:hypothetical protein
MHGIMLIFIFQTVFISDAINDPFKIAGSFKMKSYLMGGANDALTQL